MKIFGEALDIHLCFGSNDRPLKVLTDDFEGVENFVVVCIFRRLFE